MRTGRAVFGRVHPAVVAVWAAIMAIARLLPTIPLTGVGGTFTVANVLVPLAGVFFGPWAGLLCAAIGGAIGYWIFPPSAFAGPYTVLIPAVGGLASGFVMRGVIGGNVRTAMESAGGAYRPGVRGILTLATVGVLTFLGPVGIILVLGALWYAFPQGRAAWFMPPVYLLGVIAAVLGAVWGARWLTVENRAKMFAGIFLVSWAGIVASQAMGNLFWLVLFVPPPAQVAALTLQGAIERIIFAVAAAIVGVPLLTALPKVGVLVGPALYEQGEEEQ